MVLGRDEAYCLHGILSLVILISQRKEEGTGLGKKLALSGVDEANANFTGRIEFLKV